jgi:large subunit ribosomal protein L25
VTGMQVGQAVHASDLKLPPGVSLQVEPDTLVLHIIARTTEAPEETDEAAAEVPESVEAAAREGEQAG